MPEQSGTSITVWFNPWTFQSTDQIWAGLAQSVVRQVADRLGPLEREAFLERLERFTAVIARREAALLEYLVQPHDIDEIAAQNFVYSRGKVPSADAAERRSMIQHVWRLVERGVLREESPGHWVRESAL